MSRISPPFPPISELGSGAGAGFCAGEVIRSHPGNLLQRGICLVDSASEGQTESEYTGIRFARNTTGPSTQHLDGGGSEGRSSPLDPFAYDLCQGQLDLDDLSCPDNVMDEYLDFMAGSAGERPVSDAGIDTGLGYYV